MNAERARAFLLTLPHVVETMQWGDNLVFWVGDKAIGGKMFALINLEATQKGVISYAAGAARYAELLEQEGLFPAPYMARIFWIAAEHWAAHRDPAWEQELTAAHQITLAKLPPKTRTTLTVPAPALKRLVTERRRVLQAKAEAAEQPAPRVKPKPSIPKPA